MRKFAVLLITATVIAGGFYFHKHFEILGLDNVRVQRRDGTATPVAARSDDPRSPLGSYGDTSGPPPGSYGDTIRIASFNIQVFGTSKAQKRHVMEKLAHVMRMFDIVAIQEIRSKDQTIIPRFVDLINSTGVHYEHVIGPRLGRTVSKEQYAFIFNTATVQLDRSATYTVADPDDLLHREPLVALFRARAASAGDPFTFQLVNIHTDPDEVAEELNVLDDVYHAVLNDNLGERDVIVLGDLNASERQLRQLGQIPNITWALSGQKTNTRKTKSYDNLVFHSQETSEFTGRSGVVDLVREFNLTEQQALEISDHLPIWAEFSIYEGGARRIAAVPQKKKAK